jgi:flagellar biogenesis protein FliO
MMQEVPVTQTPTTPESTGAFLGSETFGIISKLVLAIVVVILFIVVAKLVVRFTKNKILQLSDLHNQEQGEKVANLIGDIVFYTLMIFAVFI